MTNKKNDGGPAFPLEFTEEINRGVLRTGYFKGLTKREYFAGLAMQAFLTMPSADKRATFGKVQTVGNYAAMAILAADALLAELAKEPSKI